MTNDAPLRIGSFVAALVAVALYMTLQPSNTATTPSVVTNTVYVPMPTVAP